MVSYVDSKIITLRKPKVSTGLYTKINYWKWCRLCLRLVALGYLHKKWTKFIQYGYLISKPLAFLGFTAFFWKQPVFFEILDVFYNIFLSQSCFRSHFSPRYITETIGWQTEKVSQHPFAVKQNSTILYGVRIRDKYKLYTTRPILYSTSFKSFLHPKQNQWRKVLTNEFIEWESFHF